MLLYGVRLYTGCSVFAPFHLSKDAVTLYTSVGSPCGGVLSDRDSLKPGPWKEEEKFAFESS